MNDDTALMEIESIKQLKARYCRYLDTKDWDSWRDVFTDDILPFQRRKPKNEGGRQYSVFVARPANITEPSNPQDTDKHQSSLRSSSPSDRVQLETWVHPGPPGQGGWPSRVDGLGNPASINQVDLQPDVVQHAPLRPASQGGAPSCPPPAAISGSWSRRSNHRPPASESPALSPGGGCDAAGPG